jgi:hypothetical protein
VTRVTRPVTSAIGEPLPVPGGASGMRRGSAAMQAGCASHAPGASGGHLHSRPRMEKYA